MSGSEEPPKQSNASAVNPLSLAYATGDGGHVVLRMPQRQRYWENLCLAIGRPDLAGDPRFATDNALAENLSACIQELDTTFATRSLEDWKHRLAQQEGPWDVLQQAGAQAERGDGRSLKVASGPTRSNRKALGYDEGKARDLRVERAIP